ncbi:RNA polymerase sigma factor SigJ [Flavobacterium sp. MXW15]|uniref:RNA polymerase sigma factor SigJ n=1 Tax=Xanthomonas chitinilytica TaxID=2989819 RepID=A0ABT3JYR1_9XANT|nr:RNA polymerase sigma factor SigJ [Xanthomonas sp. H13-6]MCW4456030.1 RNA polymerase sigma factor SigJ [Flavobacterium sp. MXW15]MCW4473627.1 RNA polymerase sigma factor SigJ [Xanthomonas sp. H13-6]
MNAKRSLLVFEERRAFLLGLAYRILGSYAEAEDAVQDTYLKWSQADDGSIDNPAAWLTATCTRRCIDMLRAARQTRVDYIGSWLPEPISVASEATPETTAELSSTLSMAFLLLLERLTPKERAAYLLYEIFDRPYPDVAQALGVNELACRKLVSRAREKVGKDVVRSAVPRERQVELLAAFRCAVETGSTARLAALMSDDVRLSADGGGKVPALLQDLAGKPRVLEFVSGRLRQYWRQYRDWEYTDINGVMGATLFEGEQIVASLSFAYDGQAKLTGIFITRNPDKLAHLPMPGARIQ